MSMKRLTAEDVYADLVNHEGEGLTGDHLEKWTRFIDATLELFRGYGETEGALIQAVLDCQNAVWTEQGT